MLLVVKRCTSLLTGLAVGMVNKPSQEPTPEFQIQQEEFPALPSAQSKYIHIYLDDIILIIYIMLYTSILI